jgi:serine/threonine-protein kinase
MGTVYLARVAGSAGFSRLVAIKRLHPELAAQREFIAGLVDEARLSSQIRHVNVIDTLDLVASDGAFSLVMEYVEGAALSAMVKAARRANEPIPQPIIMSVMAGMLRGLDAAHEARGTEGQPLGIVHRDVSPQNVLIGIDGVPRVIDFGIAKAMGRMTSTRPGEVRGKFAYMAPEQLLERPATRQADIYAAGVVMWELLTGERLFQSEDARAVCAAVVRGEIKPPSTHNPLVLPELDAIVLKATARETGDRYLTAREFLDELVPFQRASDDDVGAWVRRLAAANLAKRAELLQSVVPDQSRSVEDLMAELASSQNTPPTGQVIKDPLAGTGPFPQHQDTGRLSQPGSLPTDRTGRTGMTAGVEVSATITPSPKSSASWFLIPAFCMLGLAGLIGGVVALRHRPRPQPPAMATPAPPPPAPAPAPITLPAPAPEPDPTVAATPDPEPPTSAAPESAPRPTHPKKPPPKKPPGPKPSGTAQGSGDFDHR